MNKTHTELQRARQRGAQKQPRRAENTVRVDIENYFADRTRLLSWIGGGGREGVAYGGCKHVRTSFEEQESPVYRFIRNAMHSKPPQIAHSRYSVGQGKRVQDIALNSGKTQRENRWGTRKMEM